MSFKVKYNEILECVVLTPGGHVPYSYIQTPPEKALKLCARHNCRRILDDLSTAELGLSLKTIHKSRSALELSTVTAGVSRALVLPKSLEEAVAEFLEGLTADIDGEFRFFRDVALARRWLAKRECVSPTGTKVMDCATGLDLSWEDPRSYLWRFEPWRDSSITGVVIKGIYLLPSLMFAIVFGSLWLLGALLPAVAAWTSIIMLVFLAFALFGLKCESWERQEKAQSRDDRPLMYLLAATLLLFLMQSPAFYFASGFQSQVDCEVSTVTWLLFFLDNVFQVALLDGAEIFDLKLTGLKAVNWYTQTTVLVLRVLIGLGLLKLIWASFSHYILEMEFYGTVKDMFFHCSATMHHAKLNVRRLSRYSSFPMIVKANKYLLNYWRWKTGWGGEVDPDFADKFTRLNLEKPLLWEIRRVGAFPYKSMVYITVFLALIPFLSWGVCSFGYHFVSPSYGNLIAWIMVLAASLAMLISIASACSSSCPLAKITRYCRCWVGIAALGALAFLITTPGNPGHEGFKAAAGIPKEQWWWLIGDNAFRAFLLDIPEIYEWNLSPIELGSFLSRLLVFLFRMFLTISLIELVWELWKLLFEVDYLKATPSECFWICIHLPFWSKLELRVVGEIIEEDAGELYSVEGIATVFKDKVEVKSGVLPKASQLKIFFD